MPARGVIEVKSTPQDAWEVADSERVAKYLSKYRQALVTNYRDFVLVRQENGKPVQLEGYRLAESESAFWSARPPALVEAHGERFIEYLKRVMLHAAPLASPEEVAGLLASYARDAKSRIEGVDLPALSAVRAALEEALGIKFEGERGERFFRSTLVQTASADRLRRSATPSQSEPRFNWHEAAWYLRVPMGCDVNPLSDVLLRPRLEPPTAAEVARRLQQIDFRTADEFPEHLLVFYHPDTLTEICALKRYQLQREKDRTMDAVDRWIRMVAVNRLTGHPPVFFSVYTLSARRLRRHDAQGAESGRSQSVDSHPTRRAHVPNRRRICASRRDLPAVFGRGGLRR